MSNNQNNAEIPVRRVKVTDHSQIPRDYCTTPGGSVFSTTPGGTRIYYDRDALLNFKNSPMARSPPVGLAHSPGVTCAPDCKGKCHLEKPANATKPVKEVTNNDHQNAHNEHEEPFDLDL